MPNLWNGSDVSVFRAVSAGKQGSGRPRLLQTRVDSLSELHFIQGIYLFYAATQVLGSISDFKIEGRLQKWLSG